MELLPGADSAAVPLHNGTRPMNPSTYRWLVTGVLATAIPYVLLGFWLIRTGLLFQVDPDALRDEGFGQNPSLWTRIAGLAFFGGVGAAFVWSGWRLVRLKRRGLDIGRALAVGLGLTSASQLFRRTDEPYLYWTSLATSIAVAGYLSVPSVRALFRDPAPAPSPRADTT